MNASDLLWDHARTTRTPEAYSDYLASADPLYCAGLRLDAAAAEFQRFCSNPRPGEMDDAEEAEFGRLEAAHAAARDEYRRLIAERVGSDADTIERRLAA